MSRDAYIHFPRVHIHPSQLPDTPTRTPPPVSVIAWEQCIVGVVPPKAAQSRWERSPRAVWEQQTAKVSLPPTCLTLNCKSARLWRAHTHALPPQDSFYEVDLYSFVLCTRSHYTSTTSDGPPPQRKQPKTQIWMRCYSLWLTREQLVEMHSCQDYRSHHHSYFTAVFNINI